MASVKESRARGVDERPIHRPRDFRWALAPYVAYVQDPSNGFLSVTLFHGDGTAYSVRL
jgi:hypothetical protein